MKIVIPMSGSGNRFIEAGYKDPKPLIKVDGFPMIEYVINMFPGEPDENFIFICRDEHLKNTNMREILKSLKPNCTIVESEPAKLGPVYAVTKAFDYIKDEDQVIVNYCDFFQNWDYLDFKKTVNENQCDGNVVSYIGFHPHLLIENNYYATTKVNENNYASEIREKYSFTKDKTKCPQSGGTYYFKKGSYIKKYFKELIDRDINLNGEYYVSLIYNLMIEDNLKIHVYDKVSHFCQWGTPGDLKAYEYWLEIFLHRKWRNNE
jgi:NDP-sugar pyrophosphorylase family protein